MHGDIIDSLGDIVFIVGLDGSLRMVNRTAEVILGLKRDELVGRGFFDIIAPEYRKVWRKNFTRLLQGEGPLFYEIEILDSNNIGVKMEVNSVLYKEGGRTIGELGIARKSKKEEEIGKLKYFEELYEEIIESNPVAMYSVDSDFTIRSWNPAMEELTGIKDKEAINRSWDKVFSSLKEYGFDEIIEDVIETGKSRSVEDLLVEFPERGRKHLNAGIVPLPDGGALVTIEDITKIMEMEEEIKRRYDELLALKLVVEAITKSLDLERTLKDSLKGTLKAFKLDKGAIYLLNEDGTLELRTQVAMSEDFLKVYSRFKLGEDFIGEVAETGSPMIIGDSSREKGPVIKALKQENCKTLAILPLNYRGNIIGVTALLSYAPHHFEDIDLDFLNSITEQIAIGIENARLFTKTKELAEFLQYPKETSGD
ncbi:MAG: PAS domain S-box protein [Candidatus Hydrothermarchaeales archaeon]